MVGIYAAAMAISSMWVFIPNALIESARPIIMSAKSISESTYIKKYRQLYCSIIWIGICASIVITLLAKPIILIIYGSDFIESINILLILIWSKGFSLIGMTRAVWLTVEDLGKYQVFFVGIGAILNVVLNVILIPKYGALGAAIAVLIAEAVSTFFALLLFKATRLLFKLLIESFVFKGVKD